MSRQSAHKCGKVVSPTHRPLLPPGNIPGTHFCQRLSQPQGHSAAGRILSMTNSNDTIGNRTRDIPAFSAVPQPTSLPAACPLTFIYVFRKERRHCKPSYHSSFEHEPRVVKTLVSSVSLFVSYQPFRQRTCKRKWPNRVLSVGNAPPPAQAWTWKSDLVP